MRLTNLDKVLYPEAGFTKAEVIDYYARVADVMLPHLKGRPLTLKRYPDGVEGFNFYEKRCPEHRPDWIKTATVLADRVGEIDFCLCEDKATLVWLAQLAAIELHPSLAKASNVDRPTILAFDLDPGPPADIIDCCRIAVRLRKLFEDFGMQSFPKTSGSKGLQVYVPLNAPKMGYERTGTFAHAIALLLEKQYPDEVVSKMTKKLRKGKVLVDWSQNNRHKTTVAVYSLRAKQHPTASTPIGWDELESALRAKKPDRLRFEAGQVLKRIEKHGDLFTPVLKLRQRLPEPPAPA
ncbi:MAG: polymerase LigD, polymerase domain protein [Solirubrobacterales bacterium]|nr:polymerase LigD, polymerase domain protein [Solirubrobacterales bacterium]